MKNISFRQFLKLVLSFSLILIFTKHSSANTLTKFKELEKSYQQDLETFNSIKNKVETLKSIIENNSTPDEITTNNENYTCNDYFVDLTNQKQQLANALNITKNEIVNLSVELAINYKALEIISNITPKDINTKEAKEKLVAASFELLENVKALNSQLEEYTKVLEILTPALTNFIFNEDSNFINKCVNEGSVSYVTASLNEDRLNLTFQQSAPVACKPDGVLDFDVLLLNYPENTINWIYFLNDNEEESSTSSTNAVLTTITNYNKIMVDNSTSFTESCIDKSKKIAEPAWKLKIDELKKLGPENEKTNKYLGKTKIYNI